MAIQILVAVLKVLDLQRGNDVTPHAAGMRALEVQKIPGAKELLARLRRFRVRLPKDFKFDRMEAHERR